MRKELKTLSHPFLNWTEILPPDFAGMRLPGGKVYSAVGSFGYICNQWHQTDLYKLNYKVIDVKEDFKFQEQKSVNGLHAKITLHGKAQQEIIPGETLKLNENQWWIAQSLRHETTTALEAGACFHSMAFYFSPSFIEELLPIFPMVQTLTKNTSINYLLPARLTWADPELLELVQSILNCRYEKDWLAHFIESRLEDILFKMYVRISEDDPLKAPYSEQELQKIFIAEKLISADISKHMIIPQLSKLVLLNESRFKAVFKMVYQMGPHEYLRYKRLQKAVELFSQGMQVKQVAAATGWRPADLINAYKEKYGTTPGNHWLQN